MASISDRVLDNGLTVLDTEANRLDLCSQEPTTYTEATSTYTLGNKTSISITAPEDGSGGGRQVRLEAFTGGSVTATGTATHYAIVDTVNTRLLATGDITPGKSVTSGNTFSTDETSIRIPDPA